MTRLRLRLLTAATLVAIGVLAIAVGVGAQSPEMRRGPYLQMGTATSVVVRWRTASPSDSVVRYGTAPGSLGQTAALAGLRTDHAVALTGLMPHTRYFYGVGTSSTVLAGGDLGHSFVTAPPAGTWAPTRIWVLGDAGTADANARAVRDSALRVMGEREPDLWMMLGDNAYYRGTDVEYQAAVFDVFAETLRRAVLWPTLGNHDAVSADAATQSGPYFDIFSLPAGGEAGGVPSGTEAYYSFDYGNIHFICLDSSESDRTAGGPMVSWLQRDLAARIAEWTIVFFHHPPYSKGSHDSDLERELIEMREHVGPVLEGAGVDLVLAGHSHSYERSSWLNGHYGPSTTLGPQHQVDAGMGDEGGAGAYRKVRTPGARGTLYVVAGSAGFADPPPRAHPALPVRIAGHSSLVIDVDGPRLSLRAIGRASDRLDDVTVITHTAGGAPETPDNVRAAAGGGKIEVTWQGRGGGLPSEYVLEAGTGPGRRDLAQIGTGSLVASFQAPSGAGRFWLRARARNAVGTSAPSPEIELVVDADGRSVPPAPTVVGHRVAGDAVSLEVSPTTALTPVVGEVFEVGTAPGRRDLMTLPLASGRFAALGVPLGVYYGRVRAINAAGAGPPSRELQFVVGGVPAVPAAPGYPRAVAQGHAVIITWPPPSSGLAPDRYVLEAGLRPGATDARVATADATPRLAVPGVPSGTYYVRVRGENALGVGLASAETVVRVP